MISLETLSHGRRSAMLAAGREVLACRQALAEADLNVVGEILRGQNEFVEFEHYPHDDVFDRQTHGQYYYHAHRGVEAEHGHFHLFLRGPEMPSNGSPTTPGSAHEGPSVDQDSIAHLVAISMDPWGDPMGLFCTNRWVTGETFYPADQVIAMLDQFAINHAFPNWAVNRWISAMVRLFRPQIESLLRQRDRVIDAHQKQHPDLDVYEDRSLEITGQLAISVPEWMARIKSTAD